jgi:hypothetical protein
LFKYYFVYLHIERNKTIFHTTKTNKMNQINHSDYQKKVKTLSIESLRFIIRDCQEAMNAMPNNPKNGFYQDEIHYCVMELNKRK